MRQENDLQLALIEERRLRIEAEAKLKKVQKQVDELEEKYALAQKISQVLKSNLNFKPFIDDAVKVDGFDFDGDGIWFVDVKSRVISFSPGFTNKYGFENSSLSYVLTRLSAISIGETKSLIVNLLESEGNIHRNTFQNTCKFITLDNDERWVLEKAQIVQRDNDGRALLIIGESIDITFQKEIQEEYRIVARRFAGLLENIQMGVLVEDENRRIALVNSTFCKLFRIEENPENLIGIHCEESLNEISSLFENQTKFIKDIEKCLIDRKLIVNEEIKLRDGRVFERDYIPIFIDENYRGNLWKYRDISERKNQELILKIREEKYRSIIENMNLGILEVDNLGVIQFANQSFSRMSGLELNELLGKEAIKLFVRPENEDIVNSKSTLRKEGISDAYEINITLKGGISKWWLISGAPRYNDANELVGSIGIHLDITDQKVLEKELINAKNAADSAVAARDAFIAKMSHEIRTPMNAIIGLGSILAKTELSESQQSYLKHINNSAKNLLGILNDVLDYSKLEAGKLSISIQSFNLKEVIINTLNLFEYKIEEKGLNLDYSIDSQISHSLFGDPLRINQILINLISNAVKFTKTGGIQVKAELLSEDIGLQLIKLTITDSGVGMDSEFVSHIFEKFTQENQAFNSDTAGTGLGMTITKELVGLMNGDLEIKSRKGVGTSVCVSIPFEFDTKDGSINIHKSERSFNDLKNKRVLLVEDNPTNRIVAISMLEPFGLIIEEAVDGIEAIKKLANFSPDVILMDVQMPNMNGIEATIEIRKSISTTVPIIALTANVLQAMRDKCYNAGMNDFITKPFEEEDLLSGIAKALGQSIQPSELPSVSKVIQTDTTLNPAPLYNLVKLEKLSRGDSEFLNKMVNIFLREVPKTLNNLEIAIDQSDFGAIKATAHRLKPSVNDIGVKGIKDILEQIEAFAIEGDLSNVKSLIPEVSGTLKNVISQLEIKFKKD